MLEGDVGTVNLVGTAVARVLGATIPVKDYIVWIPIAARGLGMVTINDLLHGVLRGRSLLKTLFNILFGHYLHSPKIAGGPGISTIAARSSSVNAL
jgi:hypothetical protein